MRLSMKTSRAQAQIIKTAFSVWMIIFFMLFALLLIHPIIMGMTQMDHGEHTSMAGSLQEQIQRQAIPADCQAFCITLNQTQIDLIQAFTISYNAAAQTIIAVCLALAAIFFVRAYTHAPLRDPVPKATQYFHRERSLFRLFSPILEWYSAGIIAPKLCNA